MLDVSSYYDELHCWTRKDEGFRAFSGVEHDTVHRFLIDVETGAFSPETVHKFIDPFIPHGDFRGLDAGSGNGGTCFRNQRVHGGQWTGITISGEQLRHAQASAAARGLDGKMAFHLRSYDEPMSERFNVIVAIESLIHSVDPANTIANLATALAPGGRLVIIDDMPMGDLTDSDVRLLKAFSNYWRCPCIPSSGDWQRHAKAAGLKLLAQTDLSNLMKPRAEADLDAALADLKSQRESKIASGFGRLSDAEIGGLHLERLHTRGKMSYVMLVFAA